MSTEPDRSPSPAPAPDADPEHALADELAKIPYEPLLPIEKKLIAWSLILGLALLGLLAWLSNTFFPTAPPPPAP